MKPIANTEIDFGTPARSSEQTVTLSVTDRPGDGTWHVGFSNGALRATPGRPAPEPRAVKGQSPAAENTRS